MRDPANPTMIVTSFYHQPIVQTERPANPVYHDAKTPEGSDGEQSDDEKQLSY